MKIYSPSKLKTYVTCPFQYYLRYLLKQRSPDSAATLHGSATHDTMQAIVEGKAPKGDWKKTLVDNYKRYSPFSLHKHYMKHAENCHGCQVAKDFAQFEGDPESLRDKYDEKCPINLVVEGIDMIQGVFDRKINPLNYVLIGAEEKFTVTIAGLFKLTGRIDLISNLDSDTIEIRDWKTGNFIPTYEDCLNDWQLKIYDIVASMLYPQHQIRILTFDYLKQTEYTFTFTEREREKNLSDLIALVKEIEDREARKDFKQRISHTPHSYFKCKYMCTPDACEAAWLAWED